MAEKLVRYTCLKAFHFNLDKEKTVKKEYGGIFPTIKNLKENKHLEKFQNYFYDITKTLMFSKVKNRVFFRMCKDLTEIK